MPGFFLVFNFKVFQDFFSLNCQIPDFPRNKGFLVTLIVHTYIYKIIWLIFQMIAAARLRI